MKSIHGPVVAGSFYPADAAKLRGQVAKCLEDAPHDPGAPKAIIAPHAGYVYSGPIAGSAYAPLLARRGAVTRVVLIGPSHYVAFPGLATPGAQAFRTPLGDVPLDMEALRAVSALPQVARLDEAFGEEHSLEVHLPFLQTVLGSFKLVPLAVGQASPAEVAEVLEILWGGDETAIVVSSDLSHYLDYDRACALDEQTAHRIEALEPVEGERACGAKGINGLLLVAQRRHLRVTTADLRNSGDTSGGPRRVVGYGAFLFHEPAAPH